jgi:iron complex transport system ATP-binding protein
VLVVFHDLNLAAAYCDALSLMRDGRIAAHGTPFEVLTPRWIAAVYDLVVSVTEHPESGRPVVLLPAAKQSADSAPITARAEVFV